MSAPGQTVRTGLLGFGYAGQTFHAPLIASTPGLQLVAVASRQAQVVHVALGADVAVHADAAELIARDDIDLVVIATPNDSHHPLALAALRAGKAVVVDKPFALDAAQAAELVHTASSQGSLLSVFHNRRWDGDFLTAAALLRAGTLGRVVHAELHFDRYRPQVRQRWREAAAAGAGLWLDLAPHLLDQTLQLFGPPQAICADIATLRDGGQADDWFSAQLRYASGLRVTLGASMLAAAPGPRFALQGTRGSYVKHGLDRQEDDLKAGLRPEAAKPEAWGLDPQAGVLMLATDPAQPQALAESAWPTQRGAYPQYYVAVRDALWGRAPNPVPADQALAVMRWLDLGRRSATERRELAAE